MSLRRTMLQAFAFTVILGVTFAGAAAAAQARVHANENSTDEISERGTKPESWMPILDGHVYVNTERGEVFVMYAFRPGGEDLDGPVVITVEVGNRCLETSDDPGFRLYLSECIRQVPLPMNN